MSSSLAHVGSPPTYLPLANIAEWIFSNPFLRGAPSIAGTKQGLEAVRQESPILVEAQSGANLSWSRARDDALRIAAGLQGLGLRPAPSTGASISSKAPIVSPMVLLHLPNSLPFAPLLFGIFASGLTATMANPALTSGEINWILTKARPEAVVTTPAGWQAMKEAIEGMEDAQAKARLLGGDRVFVVDPAADDYGLPLNATRPPPGTRDWKTLLSLKPLSTPVRFAEEEYRTRTAVVLWSSGTSGKSKGVLLSHLALTSSVLSCWLCNPSFALAKQNFLGFVPFYHVFGLVNVLLLAPASGASIFVMPRFEPKGMLENVQRYRVTFLHMAPPVAVLLAKSPMLDGYDLTSVKGGVSGGAPLAPEVIQLVYKRLGFLIKVGYGLSEAGSVSNQAGETWDNLAPQLGNAGDAMNGVEIRITGVDDATRNQTLKRDEEGEILIRSPSLLSCYLDNKEATEEALDGEWFRTGDVGKIDSKGRLWITDRLKEVIKVKGFQVSPSDLENVLCGSPLVADAGVTSIYSSSQGTELPRAYVVPADSKLVGLCKPGEGKGVAEELKKLGEEVRRHVEGKVAHYKWLRGNVVFVPQIPKSPSGKILRRMLKDCKGAEVVIYPEKQRGEIKAKL